MSPYLVVFSDQFIHIFLGRVTGKGEGEMDGYKTTTKHNKMSTVCIITGTVDAGAGSTPLTNGARHVYLGPLLLPWFNFNPNMDKKLP